MFGKLTLEQKNRLQQILIAQGIVANDNTRNLFLSNIGLDFLIPHLTPGLQPKLAAGELIRECERVGAPPRLGEFATVVVVVALREQVIGNDEAVTALTAMIAMYIQNHAEKYPLVTSPTSPSQLNSDVPLPSISITKILFLSANPVEFPQLRLDIEMRNLGEELRMSHHRDIFDLQLALAVRTGDLTGHLLRHRPTIVHFAGHGTQGEGIVLLDENDTSVTVKPDVLANPFSRSVIKENLKCVLFNACWSEAQAQALATIAKIPYVVGMTTQIPDKAARAFTIGFYRALGDGLSIPQAYEFGCGEMTLRMNDTAYEKMARLLEG